LARIDILLYHSRLKMAQDLSVDLEKSCKAVNISNLGGIAPYKSSRSGVQPFEPEGAHGDS
jgi:hypothetical protein